MSSKTVIILAGPTASGKTAAAIGIAKKYSTEIISADSRQCYQELKIGVARPSEEELSAVPHHFIATQSIHETFTAADFERYALEKTEELFAHHDAVVMVGGTGLYIKAFAEGMDAIPQVDEAIRAEIRDHYQTMGIDWLQAEIKSLDPKFYEHGEIHNPQRLMRALEVIRSTGESILSFRNTSKKERPFQIRKLAIDLPVEQLRMNIDRRVDQMMQDGLLAEAESLIPFRNLNALQTVGYRELFSHFDGSISLDEAVSLIKQNTRQYAKRQRTWFKKEVFEWMDREKLVSLS